MPVAVPYLDKLGLWNVDPDHRSGSRGKKMEGILGFLLVNFCHFFNNGKRYKILVQTSDIFLLYILIWKKLPSKSSPVEPDSMVLWIRIWIELKCWIRNRIDSNPKKQLVFYVTGSHDASFVVFLNVPKPNTRYRYQNSCLYFKLPVFI
jgi:hypothetical protein